MPRRFCCDADLERIGYDGRSAARDLSELQRRGPRRTTQELINAIREEGVEGAVVLEIGAGVGAIHLALLEAGAAIAIDVDASRDYLSAARSEAERRSLADRVEYRYGDAVEVAGDVPSWDVVVLDAVICCYPYLAALLEAALRPGPRLVGLTYPHEAWWLRAAMHLSNAVSALRRRPDRWFIHRRAEINEMMAEAGLSETYRGGTRWWRVAVYRVQQVV